MQRVNVQQVSLVAANPETATVVAKLQYSLKNGKISSQSVRFSLLWDAQNSRWVVSDTQ